MTWQKMKQQVLKRDDYTCQGCLKKLESVEVHHIIPRRLKGLDSLNNLFAVCRTCHELVELRSPPKTVEDRIEKFSNGKYRDFIYCECGCGFTRSKYNEKGKIMRFINGHQNRGVNNPSYKKSNNKIFIKLPKLNGECIECEYGFIEFVYCKCGCGKTLSKYRIRNGRPVKSETRYYIKGHENIGRLPSNYGNRKIILFEEFIYCKCGCQKTKPKYDKWGRPSRFIEGHNNRGRTGLKGGFHITNGYRFILKPDHKFADSKGYVAEHRLVYEEYYKCCLLREGVIHHKNVHGLSNAENKLDNSLENLEGMTKTQHKILHGKELIHLGNHIKTRTHIKNQFGVFEIKKRNST
jgi:hypothetical protein